MVTVFPVITYSKTRILLQVIKYILNRNVCLLPSYFAINEIIKLNQQEDKPPVHWVR